MKIRTHRELEVYKLAFQIAVEIYKMSKSFQKEEPSHDNAIDKIAVDYYSLQVYLILSTFSWRVQSDLFNQITYRLNLFIDRPDPAVKPFGLC